MRGLFVLTLAGGATAFGQTMLPSTAPTNLRPPGNGSAAGPSYSFSENAPNGQSASSDAQAAPAATPDHDATVRYTAGKLEIVADGSGLNRVLREIGRVTGVRIVGSAGEEPVYGRYGPAPVAEVLSVLLNGTGSNMFLREATAAKPGELILTPRMGGATPPDPTAALARQPYVEPNATAAVPYPEANQAPIGLVPGANPTAATGIQPGGNPARDVGAAPNPQQIYQQLQRLQQTQQAVPQPQQRMR